MLPDDPSGITCFMHKNSVQKMGETPKNKYPLDNLRGNVF